MQQLPAEISSSLADYIAVNTGGGEESPYSWRAEQKGQVATKEPYIPYLAVVPDYVALNGGGFGLTGAISINMHTGQVYAGGSGSSSVVPGGSFVGGWIPNNAGESREVIARNTMNLLTGAGVDLSICSFLCVGASHAYGGDTALELGGGIKLPIKGLSGSSGVMTPVFHLPFTTGDRVINKNGTQ
jgi:hypothetical protein